MFQANVVQPHLVPIAKIAECNVGDMIDVLGVVQVMGPSSTVNTKKGESKRRNATLCDDSERSVSYFLDDIYNTSTHADGVISPFSQIDVTFWGDCSINEDTAPVGTVILLKRARVGDFKGKNT